MLNPTVLTETRKLLNIFKINDKPAGEALSDGQIEIAASIIFKINPRIACLGPTGYGKSEAVAMGVIYRAVIMRDPFVIASVKYGTSEVIMRKVIDHIFDDELFLKELELEDKEKQLQLLKRERKKNFLTFKRGGRIKIISLHGSDEDLSQAVGEHEPNIILDESPLLSPVKYIQLLKILEGTGRYEDTFLLELGNAVARNHFRQNIKFNPKYYKIDISLEQAIAEGRLDPQSVEEKKNMPFFEQFYLCQFPEEDAVDERGYRVLLTEEEIENAFVDEYEEPKVFNEEKEVYEYPDGPLKSGNDIGGGGDYNAYVLRNNKCAWIEGANQSSDTMVNVTEIETIINNHKNLKHKDVNIDDIGIGRGVSDRLKEKGYNINAVSVGEKATDSTRFSNIKAESYWAVRTWIKNGGKLKRDARFFQLSWIKYKISSDKVLQIEPKEDLKKRTGKSPDFAEALMLTFAPEDPEPSVSWI